MYMCTCVQCHVCTLVCSLRTYVRICGLATYVRILVLLYPLVPSPVQNLVVNFNTSHINITWGIPASPNGQVNYTVVVQEIDLLTREITLIEMLTVSEENLIIMYQVRPYSMYNVSVTSLTIIGEGDVVMESFITDEAGENDVNVIIYVYDSVFF